MEEKRSEESVELVRFPFSNERKHPAHVVQTVNLLGTENMKIKSPRWFSNYSRKFAESTNADNTVAVRRQASMMKPGVDLGFPVGGGANLPGRGHQHTNLPDFPKNYMKLRKFWSVGGAPGVPPWIRQWKR